MFASELHKKSILVFVHIVVLAVLVALTIAAFNYSVKHMRAGIMKEIGMIIKNAQVPAPRSLKNHT